MPSIEQSPRPHSAGKSVNFEGGGAGAGGSGAQGVRLLGLLPCQKKANDLAAILRRMQTQMTGGIVAAPSRSGRCLRSRRCRSSSASSCRAAEHSGGENAARRERSCVSGRGLHTFRQQMDLLGQLAPVGGPSTGAEQHQWPLTGSP